MKNIHIIVKPIAHFSSLHHSKFKMYYHLFIEILMIQTKYYTKNTEPNLAIIF